MNFIFLLGKFVSSKYSSAISFWTSSSVLNTLRLFTLWASSAVPNIIQLFFSWASSTVQNTLRFSPLIKFDSSISFSSNSSLVNFSANLCYVLINPYRVLIFVQHARAKDGARVKSGESGRAKRVRRTLG